MDPSFAAPTEITNQDERRVAVAVLETYPRLYEPRGEREEEALGRLQKRGYVNFVDLDTRKGWLPMDKLKLKLNTNQMRADQN